MFKQSVLVISFMCLGLVSTPVTAAEGASSSADASVLEGDSARMTNRLGAAIGIVGNPYPSILGVNAAYNVTDFLRGEAGFGQIEATTGMSINNSGVQTKTSKITTIGAGATGFMPGWNLSPTLGVHVSNVSTEGEGTITVQGFEGSGTLVYGSLGADWQASNGFNTSLGYNLPLGGKGAGSFYASLGWFFDVL